MSLCCHDVLFYSMSCNTLLLLFIFMLTSSPVWPVDVPSSWLCALFTCPYNSLSASCFLTQDDVPGLSGTFLAPSLGSVISARSQALGNGITAKLRVLGRHLAIELTSGSEALSVDDVRDHINIQICAHTYFRCIFISVSMGINKYTYKVYFETMNLY